MPKRVLTADTSSGIIAMNVETKGMEGAGRGRGGREKGTNRNREQIIAPSVKKNERKIGAGERGMGNGKWGEKKN